ncbi:methyl-accepting chemotaxis protein [Sporomusa acidovorans]|uniref:Methyl-accepting chemotaxis protein 4 n=1 Tax=Sporomusa acidovorans (strain ATCC 49682 / DSM 3132 / Mol) TaxID=1123286 RepID=A0ABZ3IXV3_SPOA4|nr:methyl-accepting chemotaxis protein [Sporomusa acidovorans]OZC22332.1 methyl-accepting chemotaxis protein McpB [Sporomusa acidovorans DSM 3132]SDE46034.1 methyl-accepting chemotaxis sensory transducer with Cache sensor [Sporomusa acidovorans]
MNSLRTKVVVAICSICFFVVTVLVGYNLYRMKMDAAANIAVMRQTMMEQFERSLKLQVEGAVSIIDSIYKEQQKGLLTEQEAKKKATDIVREIRYDNGNYLWIDTYEGFNLVLLGNKNFEGKSRWDFKDAKGNLVLQDLFNAAKANGGGGFSDYWFPKPGQNDPLPKRGYIKFFEPYRWTVGTGAWYDAIDAEVVKRQHQYESDVSQAMRTQGIIGIISLLIACGFTLLLVRSLINPLAHTQQIVHEMAAGKLTVAVHDNVAGRKDEIGSLAAAFNHMNANFRKLITQVAQSAEQIAASSQQFTANADQSAQAANQVASSIVNVTSGAEQQRAAAGDTCTMVEDMAASIGNIAANATQVSSQSAMAAGKAQDGKKSVDQAVNQMNQIEQTVNTSATVVAKLGERSKEIGQIIDTISGIAGQTNLLALNAAIEAARAGEQGRGFAVVAEEVRKLAEQSQEAAKQIGTLITEIKADTDKAVIAMNEGTREVQAGTDAVNTAGQTFSEIAAMVTAVSSQVKEISAAIEQMSGVSQTIVTAVQKIDEFSKSAVAEAQTVSAATEEQSASMEEIASSSQALAKMAQDLQNTIRQFEI